MKTLHLLDLWTTQQIPFASKITDSTDHFLHDHTFFEVFYIKNGSITHTLNGVTETLTTGDMYFLKPDDRHFFGRKIGIFSGEKKATRPVTVILFCKRNSLKKFALLLTPICMKILSTTNTKNVLL